MSFQATRWRNEMAHRSHTTRRLLFGSRVALTLTALFLLTHSQTHADTIFHNSPIAFEVTATIDPGVNVVMDAGELGLPLGFYIEIVPIGGVVTVTLDGDLVLSYDDNNISVGGTIDMWMAAAQSQSDTLGDVRTSIGYQIQPGFDIDFDEAFHNAAANWGLQVPDLQSYLITGTRNQYIPVGVFPPEVVVEVGDTLMATVDSLFLLADTYVFTEQRVDTLPLSFSVEPYPCVRVEVTGNLYTYLQYDVGVNDLCARYAPPSDTLCWTSTDPLSCLLAASNRHRFTIPVSCEAVRDYVIPICPIKASGTANVSVRSEMVLSDLELHYTCDPPGPLFKGQVAPLVNTLPVTKDSTWLTETGISFETDRDDVIFSVPVPLDSLTMTLLDGVTPLNPNDIVTHGNTYTIDWDELDLGLKQCCAGAEQVIIVYREAETADPALACSAVVDTVTDAGAYSWTTAVGCAPTGLQKFVIITEFSCPDTGAILYQARSDTLQYSK